MNATVPAELTALALLDLAGWGLVVVFREPLGLPMIAAAEGVFLLKVFLYNFRHLPAEERCAPTEMAALAALVALELAGAAIWLASWLVGAIFVGTALLLAAAWFAAGEDTDFRFPPMPFF